MTAKEFMQYIDDHRFGGYAPSPFILTARSQYAAYRQAYNVKTYREAYSLSLATWNHRAIDKGLEDKDSGRPMVRVPELETEGNLCT